MENVYSLMEFNVGKAKGRNVIVVSSCIVDNYPELIESIAEGENYVILRVCPEREHINMIGYKILSILEYSNIREITVLSVDGSLHCIQLQYILEDMNRHFVKDLKIKHLVLEKGKIYEIPQKAVKTSRHLTKVKKLLG
ncbi:MAG: hypothetical protein ACP6IP_03780 [Candidatus Njordarchaeia archaeon]